MDIANTIIGALGALYALWFAVIITAGLLKKRPARGAGAGKLRYAVLIPARNEQNVIGALVDSLMAMEYPKELFDVYALVNNCTDDTAGAASRAGAKVLDCNTGAHSKGEVLSFAFNALKNEDYDAFCVLDADNLVDKGFLKAIDGEIGDFGVVQAYRGSKNPSDGWVAGDMSIFFWMMNRLFNSARRNLGMSALLNGTGIVIRKEVVDRFGYGVSTLTEDLEYTAMCALNDVKIGYAPGAVVYDEQPSSLRVSLIQRRRWFAGTRQCFLRYFLCLLRKATPAALDIMFIFFGVPMQLFGLFSGVNTVVRILIELVSGTGVSLSLILFCACPLVLAYVLSALFALAVCALEKQLTKERVGAVLMFPLFLVSWFIANVWALFTPSPGWQHIAHTRAIRTPER